MSLKSTGICEVGHLLCFESGKNQNSMQGKCGLVTKKIEFEEKVELDAKYPYLLSIGV
jgi:hypothetical protein